MSYEAPVLSKKHGFGDAKASEASTRLVQARLIQGEKPVNGLTKPLPELNENGHRQDFKLLIDPAIKKGHSKIYRYNGVFPGVRWAANGKYFDLRSNLRFSSLKTVHFTSF